MNATTAIPMTLSHLDELEAEAIHIMREVAAERERPVLLFSGGKDSIVLLRLAEKAFRPGKFPFPLMHVDTGHNFPEVIAYRDRWVAELGERLVVASVQESIDKGRVVEETGPRASRNQPPDDDTSRRDHGAWLRRRHGRRPPRRGARPREGAHLQFPRRLRAVEPACTATGALEPLQRPDPEGRSRSASSRSRTGRSSMSGSTSPASASSLPGIYFAHEREVFRRDGDDLRRLGLCRERLPGEDPFPPAIRSLPHRRRHELAPVASSRTPATIDEVVDRDRGHKDHRTGARHGQTTALLKQRWRTASVSVIFLRPISRQARAALLR